MSDILVVFRAEIRLNEEEIEDAHGRLDQAVQNEIGHTGANVLDIESEGESQ